MRNTIEPSGTRCCTHFDDGLCEPNGLFDLTDKTNQTKQITSVQHSYQVERCEAMLMELDQETHNELLKMYYITLKASL